jgi:hypothetical protein
MRHQAASRSKAAEPRSRAERVDVSIVMPCLNEYQCLPHCIANAREALRRIQQD